MNLAIAFLEIELGEEDLFLFLLLVVVVLRVLLVEVRVALGFSLADKISSNPNTGFNPFNPLDDVRLE